MSTATETPSKGTLERAARKEADKTAAQKEKERKDQIARLERQFLNVAIVQEWAKLQMVPLVLDAYGNQPRGFNVDPAMLERFNRELVAALEDKIELFSGKVRQGKVREGETVFTLS